MVLLPKVDTIDGLQSFPSERVFKCEPFEGTDGYLLSLSLVLELLAPTDMAAASA